MENKQNKTFLTCKDHTVSGEEFKLVWNEKNEILITQPQPSPEKLPNYYESEDYISHTDSTKKLSDKLYQGVKNFMLQKKLKLIESSIFWF